MDFWNYTLEIGELAVTPKSFVTGLVLFFLLGLGVSRLKRLLQRRFLPRLGLNLGVAVSVSTLIAYLILIIGALTILPVMVEGFNIATLSLMLGAVSFGIGFGLRNVADNFVSGLILLIERPIKVSDRIEVAGVQGTVTAIRIRSTTVRTNDNIEIIVPNSQFISEQVINLSYSDPKVRFKVPVGVHYNSDARVVQRALLEAAGECDGVLKTPPPAVRFMHFGDSSLDFEVRVWTDSLFDRPHVLISNMNFLIWEKFRKYGVQIPYPQRDLYIKEMPGARTGAEAGSVAGR